MISLSPEQVEQRLQKLGIPCHFTPEERETLDTIPVVETPLDIFAFPTPVENSGLTLFNIMSCVGTDPSRQPSFFDHPWLADESFMHTQCPAGWHFIAMDVISGTIHQPIDYIRRLSSERLMLPTAVEIVLMLFLHYVGTGAQLLQRKHTWCSDFATLDRHVTVGAFGRNGVFVSGHPGDFASRGLGICAKVQP